MSRCPWVNEDIFKRKESLTDKKTSTIKEAKCDGMTVFFFILQRFCIKRKKNRDKNKNFWNSICS